MRRYGEAPKSGQVYRDRPGAYAVILSGHRIMLTREDHPITDYIDIQLPGGGVDPGETMLSALHREVMEETGHRIHVQRKLTIYQRYCYMPEYDLWARKIAHIYLCRPGLKISEPTEKTHEYFWIDLGAAPGLITNPADGRVLERFFDW